VLGSAAVAGHTPDPAARARLAAALTLLSGAILLVTGLLRAGFVARFLAPEALRGFLFGLAVVIVVRQIAAMTDVTTRDGDAFVRSWDVLRAIPHWSVPSLLTGMVTLIVLIVFETRLPRLPATLLVLIAAGAVATLLHLDRHGVAHVPAVAADLPRLRLPDVKAHDWYRLLSPAAGMALIVFVLGHGIAERLREPDEPSLDASREMTADRVANLLAGLAGGLAVTGSPSASAAAHEAHGGRSRWLPALCAVLLAVVAVALAPAFALLPEPALAAVVVMAVRPFLRLNPLRALWSADRRGFAVSATAVLGVVTLTLIPGLLLAVALSLLIFIADASRLRVSELGRLPSSGAYLAIDRFPDAVRPACAIILRPDGQLFFANTGRLVAAVDADLARPDRAGYALILDLGASFDLRPAVLDALSAIRRRATAAGRELRLAHLYLSARDAVQASDLADVSTFHTLDEAVAATTARP
jgi:MFS superfamily sulfate permease-like transporter